MNDVILKRFEAPDEVRKTPKGRFEVIRIGGLTIGRATYEPGWKWSVHVGPSTMRNDPSVVHAIPSARERDGGPGRHGGAPLW